jgi:hypothetical protein
MKTKIILNNSKRAVLAFEGETQVGQIDFVITNSLLSIEHTINFEGYERKGVSKYIRSGCNRLCNE